MQEKEITFIRHYLTPFEAKLAKLLKKKGYKINLISFYKTKEEYIDIFDKHIYLLTTKQKKISKTRKILKLPKFFFSIRKIKKNIGIGVSEPNWFVTFIFMFFKRKFPTRVYFPYDIAYFRKKDYKKNFWHERFSEKYNFRHCQGIIHKGPENELNWLPEKFNASNVPNLQFLLYCDENLMINIDDSYMKNKLSNKDGNIHLVYVGRAVHNDPGRFSDIEIFKEIVNQNLFLHLYAINYDKISTDPEYKKLQENKFFKLHKPIYGANLQKELSKYDWGINIFHTNFNDMKEEWAKTAYGNKISTYLESGIPSIVNEEMKFSAEIVKNNGFGITIKEIDELSHKIKNTDYNQITSMIRENREKFTLEKNLDNLLEFIDSCKKK